MATQEESYIQPAASMQAEVSFKLCPSLPLASSCALAALETALLVKQQMPW